MLTTDEIAAAFVDLQDGRVHADSEQVRAVFRQAAEALSLTAELAEATNFTYCAYCNARFQSDGAESVVAIDAHIRKCPNHPMRDIEAERDAVAAENVALRGAANRVLQEGAYFFDEHGHQWLRLNARSYGNPVMEIRAALSSPSPAVAGVEAEREVLRAWLDGRDPVVVAGNIEHNAAEQRDGVPFKDPHYGAASRRIVERDLRLARALLAYAEARQEAPDGEGRAGQ